MAPRIDPETRALVRLLFMNGGYSYRDIARKCRVSVGSVRHIMTRPLRRDRGAKKKHPGGRPRAIDVRSRRLLLRQVSAMREKCPSFSVRQLQHASGLSKNCSLSTCYREMIRAGYSWSSVRRKGVLTQADKKRRLAWCKQHLKTPPTFWTTGVAFYLDGVSFQHKLHPMAAHCAPGSRAWLKKEEKLLVTGKGSHEGSGGRSLRFLVGVSFGGGVVICSKYEKMSAKFYAGFVKGTLPQAFLLSKKPRKVFLQDNDPSQTSKAALRAMAAIGAEQFFIPPRSPDLNPVENLFHLVKKKLAEDAVEREIRYESIEEFEKRVISTIHEVAALHMDKTILTMTKRIHEIVKSGGARCAY